MAEQFYRIEIVPHLENETGEFDYIPYYEINVTKDDMERFTAAWSIEKDCSPIEFIGRIIDFEERGHPYIMDAIDLAYLIMLCRSEPIDAYHLFRDADDYDGVHFEVTVNRLLDLQD